MKETSDIISFRFYFLCWVSWLLLAFTSMVVLCCEMRFVFCLPSSLLAPGDWVFLYFIVRLQPAPPPPMYGKTVQDRTQLNDIYYFHISNTLHLFVTGTAAVSCCLLLSVVELTNSFSSVRCSCCSDGTVLRSKMCPNDSDSPKRLVANICNTKIHSQSHTMLVHLSITLQNGTHYEICSYW